MSSKIYSRVCQVHQAPLICQRIFGHLVAWGLQVVIISRSTPTAKTGMTVRGSEGLVKDSRNLGSRRFSNSVSYNFTYILSACTFLAPLNFWCSSANTLRQKAENSTPIHPQVHSPRTFHELLRSVAWLHLHGVFDFYLGVRNIV
jgi:hypothetical protein